jgi:hypothetical protein
MNLSRVYDVILVLNINRKHSTMNKHFSKHIQFTIIYLLQTQKLNYNKYSEQEINMSNFVQAKEYDMNMHVKIQCMNMHGFLKIIS